jgi:putative ABC transport system permease protein
MSLERWLYTLPLRIRSLFRRPDVERELDEEIRDHLERQVAANVALGMSPVDARTSALREFGGVERRKEEVRETRGFTLLEHLVQDVRFAARTLRKSPVFTTVAVLTLALGIGANTAIFAVVQSVLLRPVPYAHPDRLVAAFETDTHGNLVGISKLDFQDWRRATTSFVHLAAVGRFYARIKNGGSSSASSAQVSPELFDVLGVPPMLGTVFTDFNQNVVISEGFWKRQLGGIAGVVGTTLVVDDTARVITGVMPSRFDFPHGTEIWIPQDMIPRVKVARTIRYWQLVGDLKPGITVGAAQAELAAVASRLAAVYPTTNAGVGAKVMDLEQSMTGQAKPTLVLLIVIAGLVLLLACANLANLMLVRGVTRRRELALRAALGATRHRLQGQLLTECLMLSTTGAILGLPLALWCNRLMRSMPELRSLPFELRVSDQAVFAFAALTTLVTTLVFGMAPAVRASRVDVVQSLKEAGTRGVTALGLSGALVTGEVALATLLLVAATLTARSLARLEGESLGFDPDNLVVIRTSPAPGTDASAWLAHGRAMLDEVRRVPGIASAAFVDVPPFAGRSATSVFIEGEPSGDRASWHQAMARIISDGYFQSLGVKVMKGREFDVTDDGAEPMVMINELLAKQYLSWRDPIGARIALPEIDSALWSAHQRGEDVWATVIGVVGDIRETERGIPPQPTAYFASGQHPAWMQTTMIARTSVPLNAVRRPLISAATANPGAPATLLPVNDLVMRSVVAPRVRAFVLSAFAGLALVLAAIGVYGVTAHVTAQRTAEIGIRMALGARSAQVLAAVSGRIVRFTLAGLVLGMIIALASSRLISAFLYGIGPSDLAAYAAAGILATGIAAVAAWIPARRATRVDPVEALRTE